MTLTNNRATRRRPARGVRFVDRDTVRDAVEHLRIARNLLAGLGAQKALEKVRLALKSAAGAQRHVDGLHGRAFPIDHAFWIGYCPRLSVIERLHSAPIAAAAAAVTITAHTDASQKDAQ